MIIIDAGVHIWLPQAPDRPWMPGRTAHLPEPLTYQKFSAMMHEAGVGHAILVPPSWEGDRIDYSLEAAQNFPDRFAVMGRFPINKPEERAHLETWRQQQGMLGVRLTLHHEWDRAWMRRHRRLVLTGGRAPRHSCVLTRVQPSGNRRSGSASPRCASGLNPGASTGVKAEALEPQIRSTAGLAKQPNVDVK